MMDTLYFILYSKPNPSKASQLNTKNVKMLMYSDLKILGQGAHLQTFVKDSLRFSFSKIWKYIQYIYWRLLWPLLKQITAACQLSTGWNLEFITSQIVFNTVRFVCSVMLHNSSGSINYPKNIFCVWPLAPQLGLQCHYQERQQWQKGRRRPYSVTSQVSTRRNCLWHGTSKMAPTWSMQVQATSSVSALKWLFTIQTAPTVFAVASLCTPQQWQMETYTSSARWSTRPTASRTTDLLHCLFKVGFLSFTLKYLNHYPCWIIDLL